jgi:hypothetical protein
MIDREKYLARQRRYNDSEKGRARWTAYYLRRESDPTPVHVVRDRHGDEHVVTKGELYRLTERQRKDMAARKKRIAARAVLLA